MRISDWSSDVCSSDLADDRAGDGRCHDAAARPWRSPVAAAEPQAEADRRAEPPTFRRTGDVAGRSAEQQLERIEAEQFRHCADQPPAQSTANDRPAPEGTDERRVGTDWDRTSKHRGATKK